MGITMEKNSKIYVAGHRGLVGSYLVKKMQEEGYTNIITATSKELDLRNSAEVAQFFEKEKPEYVFLVAAKRGGVAEYAKYPVEFLAENEQIEINVIMNSLKNNVKKLVFVAASCVYSEDLEMFTEADLMKGWVQHATEPYALAKAVGIKLCEYCNQEYGTKFVSMLPVNIYGITDESHTDNTSVIPAMLERFSNAVKNQAESVTIWGDGKTRREFLHAKDLASGILAVMNSDLNEGWVNIGYGSMVTINELAELIAKVTGFKGKIEHDLTKPNGSHRKVLDIKKIESIGWKPEISLEEGLKEIYKAMY